MKRKLVTFSLLLAIAAAVSPAQVRINGGLIEAPKPGKPSVYVRDSAVAAEKLALAQRMEHLKEWNKSADVYQEIVEKFADRVVPSDDPGETTATRYSSVTLKVQSLLGKWPAEGLQVYRSRYEAPAATMLASADVDDVGALNRVVQRYFPTDAAKTASLRLMELSIENGEFAAAAWLGERLLTAHPGLANDRPTVLFRTALAEHMAGNDAAAKTQLDELKQQFATATGTIMGKDAILADELAKMLAQPAPVSHGAAPDSWPMFGGDPSRGRIPDAGGRPAARIAEIPLPRERPGLDPDVSRRGSMDALQKQRRELGLSLGVIPSIDRGELFFQDGKRIYAYSVDTGERLPGWSMTATADPGNNPNVANRRIVNQPPSAYLPGSPQMLVTVTDGAVLAILGQSARIIAFNEFGGMTQAAASSELVCIDRATGARRWSASPSQFPASMASLRTLTLNGSPLVIGDNVYVAARGGKPMQFEDAYVLCFSLSDGRLRWACYIASGNAPGENFTGIPVVADSLMHVAYAGGRIYAATNLGAIASIDAYTGTIAWLDLYPRTAQPINPMIAFANQPRAGNPQYQRKPWSQNPPIVRDGKVFILPGDSANVMVYDAATGKELHRIPMEDFENADTLLSIVGDRLLVASTNKVFCINWPTYDDKKEPAQNLFWNSGMPAPMSDPKLAGEQGKDTIRGRGFVTADSVFVATRWNLVRLRLDTGLRVETYPKDGAWPAREGPGNIIVSQDNVIIAGADSILVYSDLSLARAKLDKAIADAPTDPLPRLKYADTLFAAGDIDGAIAKLDEAISLLGGLHSMRPGVDRDRVFAGALTFAERSADPKIGAADPARAGSLYDRAQAAANSPPQQVNWRLSRARFARTRQDFAAEVRLYQEILLDPALRGVNVPAEDGSGAIMAANVAESAIRVRMRAAPEAYAPFEQAATQALAAAKAANDPNQILAVAQSYPNAKVAADAMFAAADAYESAGKHRPAVQVLGQLYRKYRDSADKARILEAQARNYLPLPSGISVAIGRFNEGAKLPNGPQLTRPLKLPDGSTIEGVTFGAAAELLQKYSADLDSASQPEFNLPIGRQKTRAFLPEAADTVIRDVDAMVLPPRELRRFARYDRVATWTNGAAANGAATGGGGISIYAIGSNKPLGVNSTITTEPRGGIWIGNDLLVWTSQKISLLHGDGAAAAWEVNVTALPAAEIVAADVDAQPAPADDPQQQQNIRIVGGNGGVVIIDNQVAQIRAGRVILPNGMQIVGGGMVQAAPRRKTNGEEIDHVRPVGDRVLVATSGGRVCAIELNTGQIVWQSRVTDAPFQQVVASDDFVATRFTDDYGTQIVAMDTFTGQIVWRRIFSPDNGQVPVNMIFSPDGTLLFTMPDRLCGMDLYEPSKGLKFGDGKNIQENAQIFIGAVGPDQLVVSEGRVLALADGGQYVRILSLDDGQPIPRVQSLSTGANNWNVQIRVVGPMVYVINQRAVQGGFNIDRPDDNWEGIGTFDPQKTAANIRDVFIGKRHLVLLSQPTDIGVEAAPISAHFHLDAYGRYPRSQVKTAESGVLDQTLNITNPAGIDRDQWQPVNGGFYYRSADRQAHFLRGSGPGN